MTLSQRRIWRSLRANPLQGVAMWAALAIGTTALVALMNAVSVLQREVPENIGRAQPHEAVLWFERVDAALLEHILTSPDVAAAERRAEFVARAMTNDGQLRAMRVTVLDQPLQRPINRLFAESSSKGGQNNGPEEQFWLERSGRDLLRDAKSDTVGSTISTRSDANQDVTLPITGWLFDPLVAPSTQEQTLYAYATLGSARLLFGRVEWDQVAIRFRPGVAPMERGEALLRIRDSLAANGFTAPLRTDSRPATHPHAPLMNATLRFLEILGVIITFAVAATVMWLASVWMRRETTQIAVMKSIGAGEGLILNGYVQFALALTLSAALIATPLGVIASRLLISAQLVSFNIDLLGSAVSARTLAACAASVAFVGVAALLLPAVLTLRRPVANMLRNPGLTPPSRFISAIRWLHLLPGPTTSVITRLALRNAWRRPTRLLAIVAALTCGSALLLIVRTNYQSYLVAIDDNLSTRRHNVEVLTSKPFESKAIALAAHALPDIDIVEPWARARVTPAQANIGAFTLSGVPETSAFFTPKLVAGRLPIGGTADEIAITRALQLRYPALKLGELLEVGFRERRTNLRIVGMVDEIVTPAAYAPQSTYVAVTGLADTASALRVRFRSGGQRSDAERIDRLERALMREGVVPTQVISARVVRESLLEHFEVVGGAMRLVAAATLLLGGFALIAFTAFNSSDRSRELAILRALGAPPTLLTRVMLIECASVVAAGFLLAIPIATWISRTLLDLGERLLVQIAVPMQFSGQALLELAIGTALVFALLTAIVRVSTQQPLQKGLAHE